MISTVYVLFACYPGGFLKPVEVSQSREYLLDRIKYFDSLLAYPCVEWTVRVCESFSEV